MVVKRRVLAKKKKISPRVSKRRVLAKRSVRKIPKSRIKKTTKKAQKLVLAKHHANPIIAPRKHVSWESWQTFNPAALYENGKVHLLYRAIGESGLSVVGYANSTDGITVDERSDKPVYGK